MNQVKTPKKPLIFYYCIAMAVLLVINFLAVPWLAEHQIQEIDYGTFMDMADNQQIGQVEIQENQILFTNKDETAIYKTGLMNDPDLVTRLHNSGAKFSSEIIQETSPLLQVPALLDSAGGDFRRPGPVHVPEAHEPRRGRPLLDDVRHGQQQRQSLRQVLRGHPLLRRGR